VVTVDSLAQALVQTPPHHTTTLPPNLCQRRFVRPSASVVATSKALVWAVVKTDLDTAQPRTVIETALLAPPLDTDPTLTSTPTTHRPLLDSVETASATTSPAPTPETRVETRSLPTSVLMLLQAGLDLDLAA
jgi:hypothetical protein